MNITIRMKPCDDNQVNEYQITISGVGVDKMKEEIVGIMSNPDNEILSIYDIEEKLKEHGYENDYVTGEVIFTIYEYDYSCIMRIQEEKYVSPDDYGLSEFSDEDAYSEFVTVGFVRIFNNIFNNNY